MSINIQNKSPETKISVNVKNSQQNVCDPVLIGHHISSNIHRNCIRDRFPPGPFLIMRDTVCKCFQDGRLFFGDGAGAAAAFISLGAAPLPLGSMPLFEVLQ